MGRAYMVSDSLFTRKRLIKSLRSMKERKNAFVDIDSITKLTSSKFLKFPNDRKKLAKKYAMRTPISFLNPTLRLSLKSSLKKSEYSAPVFTLPLCNIYLLFCFFFNSFLYSSAACLCCSYVSENLCPPFPVATKKR